MRKNKYSCVKNAYHARKIQHEKKMRWKETGQSRCWYFHSSEIGIPRKRCHGCLRKVLLKIHQLKSLIKLTYLFKSILLWLKTHFKMNEENSYSEINISIICFDCGGGVICDMFIEIFTFSIHFYYHWKLTTFNFLWEHFLFTAHEHKYKRHHAFWIYYLL